MGMVWLVLAGTSVLFAQSQPSAGDILYQRLTTPGQASVAALNTVLRESGTNPAHILFIASGLALRENRHEDAGFLFHIAGLRAQYDTALFPPTGTGGDSPMVALGALRHQMGAVINPALIVEPKSLLRALDRVNSWQPRAPRNYQPGYEFSVRGDERLATTTLQTKKRELINSMRGLATLMLDQTYFDAFKTGQSYNLTRGPDRPSREVYDAALATMLRIETEKGIEGTATQMKR